MARLVYGCRFDVPGEDAWGKTVQPLYQGWISDRYRKAFQASIGIDLMAGEVTGQLPDGHLLTARRHRSDAAAVELEWSFPGERGLVWRNFVRTAELDDRVVVEHRVEISSSEFLVSPASYSVGAPGVIRRLCQQEVLVGDMRVRATVYPLRINGVDQFVELLEAKNRRLPIVLVTPYANGEASDLDASALAGHLAGVAIVTEADTPETTRALSDDLGRLGCYDGGVRVYWPEFTKNDELTRHPLMLSSRIAILGPQHAARNLERSIFSVAAFRFAPDPRIGAIIAKSEATIRAERAQEVVSQGSTTWEQYALEISGKLDETLAELEALKSENVNLRANQSALFAQSEDGDDEVDDIGVSAAREPTSVSEAVEFAIEDCNHLTFLESSRSAADDSPFKRPGEIYEVLISMNKVASVWAKNQGSGDLRQMLKEAGLGRRVSNFISTTTKSKWGDEYTFYYDGQQRIFEWHVTLGAGSADTCASIHFLPDPLKGKLVIGHVGRHLTNTRS